MKFLNAFGYLFIIVAAFFVLESCCPGCPTCPTNTVTPTDCNTVTGLNYPGTVTNDNRDYELKLGTVFGPSQNGNSISLKPKEGTDDSYFLLDVVNSNSSSTIQTKFTQIPHHPVAVYDHKGYQVIGFLEVIDTALPMTNMTQIPESSSAPTKTYSINIPSNHMGNFGSILIYSPQTDPHKKTGISSGQSHMTDGVIGDPRK